MDKPKRKYPLTRDFHKSQAAADRAMRKLERRTDKGPSRVLTNEWPPRTRPPVSFTVLKLRREAILQRRARSRNRLRDTGAVGSCVELNALRCSRAPLSRSARHGY